MINRYQHSQVQEIFSASNRASLFIQIEKKVLLVQNPEKAHLDSSFDQVNVETLLQHQREYEKETKHETTAFLKALMDQIPEEAHSLLHKGMTSSDLLDTGLSLQIQQAGKVLLSELSPLFDALYTQALHHKSTLILGRSHGKAGELTSFGLILLGFYAEWTRLYQRLTEALDECATGCISGPMGNFSLLTPQEESQVCEQLGLRPEPVSTQVIPRDRHASLMAQLGLLGASLDRLSVEIRHLSQSGIDEVAESFSKGQQGSSAMPHKKNPILCENLSGLARLLKSYVSPALENVSLWYERDMSHSSVERVIIEDAFHLACFGVKRLTKVIQNLYVNTEQMTENIKKQGSHLYSHTLLNALMDKSMTRNQAYTLVQGWAMSGEDLEGQCRRWNQEHHFFSEDEVESLFNPQFFLRHVDVLFQRVPQLKI